MILHSNNSLYVFGGNAYDTNGLKYFLNDLWRLDPGISMKWILVYGNATKYDGPFDTRTIIPRQYHSMVYDLKNSLYIFGGQGKYLNGTNGIISKFNYNNNIR